MYTNRTSAPRLRVYDSLSGRLSQRVAESESMKCRNAHRTARNVPMVIALNLRKSKGFSVSTEFVTESGVLATADLVALA